MSYLDETLTSGEKILYRTGLHWSVMFWPVVLSAILGIAAVTLLILGSQSGASAFLLILAGVCVVIGAMIYAIAWARRASIEMAVTNRRVLIKSGILGRKTLELVLTKVESIGVEQGFVGRMGNFGRVVIRGTGGTHEVFERIAHPLEFRRHVQEQIQQEPGPEADPRASHARYMPRS